MKILPALILLLFLIVHHKAQTPENPTESAAPKNAALAKNVSDADGKFNLPPEKKEPVRVAKFSAAPVIDGRLDEEIWQTAPVLKDFYQTNPGNNIAASKPTEVRLGYDEKNLYIAFKCWDEPDKIRATVAKRDEVFGEDNVRVWLDTYNDQRRAYVLGFNPLGIQQDGIYTEGRGADFSVDIVMESKGVIESWGWSVEIKIPFKSLRYTAGKGKFWGFNAARNIDRLNDELDQWLPDDRNISGFLIKHGKITGLEEIKTERTIEVVPSVTLSESGNRRRTILQSVVNNLPPGAAFDPGRFVNSGVNQDIGVNLKFNLTPNVTLDAAYNPDYAEIEADAAVVTANQRFPIFFQEKRPFFLEGADIFQDQLQTFYSRQIVDPDIAVKLTGKSGKNTFGLLAASDNAPGNYSEEDRNDPGIRPSGEFLDKNAQFLVARLKRDVGRENYLGFFGTLRSFPRQHNVTAGFDGKFKLNPATTLVFEAVGTTSRRNFYDPETNRAPYRTGNGFGYYFSLDYTTDRHGWFFESLGRSQFYRADSGFTRRVNTNTLFFANRVSTQSKPNAKLIRLNWSQFARLNYNWQGRSQDGFVGSSLNFQFKGNFFVSSEFGVTYERLFEEEFGAKRGAKQIGAFFGASERSAYQPYVSTYIEKNFSKKFDAYASIGTIRNAFDYDFGNGFRYPRVSPAYFSYLRSPSYAEYQNLRTINPFDPNNFPPDEPQIDPGKGQQYDFQIGGNYKPIDPLRISLDYTKSLLKRYDTNRVAYDTNIISLRSTYQFTRFIFARARIDYNTLSSNIGGQLLFGWNPNPGTAFYAGYNDNVNYNGFSPYTGQYEPGIERNGRTFFIRMSYLFRKSF
jgi:hypothetical protein